MLKSTLNGFRTGLMKFLILDQVLGESLAEYANLTPSRAPGVAPAVSGQPPNVDLIDLEEGTGGAAGGGGGAAGRMSTPPKSLPTAPVPKLEGPPK